MKKIFYITIPGNAVNALQAYLERFITEEKQWLNVPVAALKADDSLEKLQETQLVSGSLPLHRLQQQWKALSDFHTVVMFSDPYRHLANKLQWLHTLAYENDANKLSAMNPMIRKSVERFGQLSDLTPDALGAFVKWLEDESIFMFHNMQGRVLAGLSPRMAMTEKHCEKVLRHLCRVRSIGIVERFEEFIFSISYQLGIEPGPDMNLPPLPPASKIIDINNPEIRKVLQPMVAYDLKLYEEAKSLFIDQLHDVLKEVEKNGGGLKSTFALKDLLPDADHDTQSSLVNTGIGMLNETTLSALQDKEKTIVVIGVARGGTSLVAGVLDHLGVFTGERSRSPVYEDVALAEAYESGDRGLIKRIIEDYNGRHNTWAFKRPKAVEYLEELHQDLRNPIYLFIFKDIFAIANRNTISMQQETVIGMKKVLDEYGEILQFIETYEPAGLLLSYEKVLEHKRTLVQTVVEQLKITATKEQVENAMGFIAPNPTIYLDITRVNKTIGRIESITSEKVTGWAKYLHSDKVAKVELYINDVKVLTTLANKKELNNRKCGFEFSLKSLNIAKPPKSVKVKVKDDVMFLKMPLVRQ